MTLTEFLLARIAEDEAVRTGEPVRTLHTPPLFTRDKWIRDEYEADLKRRALPYADHPDYDPDWRP
jgi:hypothetical protein